jgi:hypothetical protein
VGECEQAATELESWLDKVDIGGCIYRRRLEHADFERSSGSGHGEQRRVELEECRVIGRDNCEKCKQNWSEKHLEKRGASYCFYIGESGMKPRAQGWLLGILRILGTLAQLLDTIFSSISINLRYRADFKNNNPLLHMLC